MVKWVESLSVTHYDQSWNTLSETRKRFEHLLLSQTRRLLKQDELSVLTKWMQILSLTLFGNSDYSIALSACKGSPYLCGRYQLGGEFDDLDQADIFGLFKISPPTIYLIYLTLFGREYLHPLCLNTGFVLL